MLLSLFRSNQPMVMVFLFLTMLVLWIIPYSQDYHFQDALLNGGILYKINKLPSDFILLTGGLLAAFFQAILINVICNKGGFYAKETHLPGAIYVFAISYDPRSFFLSSEHLFFLVFLIAIRMIINIRRDFPAIETTYLFGLSVAVASLVHLPGLLVIPVAWIFLAIIRPFNWREYIAPLLGVMTVGAFVLSWYMVFSEKPPLESFLSKSNAFVLWQSNSEEITFALYSLAGIFLLLGLVRWFAVIQKSTMRYKKLTRSLILGLLTIILINIWIYSNNYPHYLVFGISMLVAFLSTYYFFERRWNNVKVILFHLFLAGIIINHII